MLQSGSRGVHFLSQLLPQPLKHQQASQSAGIQDVPETSEILQSHTPWATMHSCAGDRAPEEHRRVESWIWPNVEINGHNHAEVATSGIDI